ncbi:MULTISPECIES: glycine cleavage system aminomethyltransferase GcvT [unclassified Sphingomonas]|uniref:glycine cleavage system aminomethyltransferase GcvT n=1 Tax=Sphingomonas TaxID=13687 RepID=UPI000962B558|nr:MULTISPECIES: glycine cleavage system aminomethyltransferase GcvT [unclassified Sphingomonas]MBN8812495.1 glycine cleavage system aminomethyltransferase GcvT [Sphingomonas sp.]OJY52254.1 MAG: glycine cleavage system protein T [Sphingomonas sp. 67-41]
MSGDPEGGDGTEELRLLPLDQWHRARGGRMVPFAGYEMPVQYEGIMAEHLWVRAHAGLFDVSHMGQLTFTGEGVEAALEALMPADIQAAKLAHPVYSLLMAENGGILDDLMLTRLGEGEVYMVVNGACKWDDIAHFREFLPDEVGMNHMEDHALLALQGPEAAAALERVVPGVSALVFMQGAPFQWQGHDLWISRSGYTGEDGFELSVPVEGAEALADAITAQPEVKPIGLGARDSLRLEADLPLYGHDLDAETTPVAAALGFALKKRRREEGGFPGHARIMLERENGSILKRVGLVVEGRQPVREGGLVLDADGNEVGKVTSGGFAPTLQQPIAMAYVPAASAEPGTKITLAQRGKIHSAEVVKMPFVPHRYVRKGA